MTPRWRGWRALFGLVDLPAGFAGRLSADERVLAWAPVPGDDGALVLTQRGLWLPEGRRIGWHLISKASWGAGRLSVVEAEERGMLGEAVLLVDQGPRRLDLPEPGRVPEIVHQRVTGSIRARHRVEVRGGGAWFLRRAVPGRDGLSLQVRPDPGTDVELLRALLPEVAYRLRENPS